MPITMGLLPKVITLPTLLALMATMSIHIRCKETSVHLRRIIPQTTTTINRRLCPMETQLLISTPSRPAPCRVVLRRMSTRHRQCLKFSRRNRKFLDQRSKHPLGLSLNHGYRKVYLMASSQSSRRKPCLARSQRGVSTTSFTWVANSPKYPSRKQPYRHIFRESLETKSRSFLLVTVV